MLYEVITLDTVRIQIPRTEAFEDAERDQRREALAVGRDFVQFGIAEALRQGAAPIGAVIGEIGGVQRRA